MTARKLWKRDVADDALNDQGVFDGRGWMQEHALDTIESALPDAPPALELDAGELRALLGYDDALGRESRVARVNMRLHDHLAELEKHDAEA